ncbi:flavin reductase family protein [uncultured Aeromicrobium sp.]|uniref:flavin reductase family protein n=1 Tax=uncultured Aeromicrobium sp. TaxID=337820 RepID=UPI0025F724DE|nr:flavin reductase family protein [uncultured Aeromicrobium sp.]
MDLQGRRQDRCRASQAGRELPAGPVEHRFGGVEIAESEHGALVIGDGLAQFDTTVYLEVEAGDHRLVLLRLHAFEHPNDPFPLVFHQSGFGRLATSSAPSSLAGTGVIPA